MPQMMVKIYQMLNLSKGVPDTPNLNEAIIGPCYYLTEDRKSVK